MEMQILNMASSAAPAHDTADNAKCKTKNLCKKVHTKKGILGWLEFLFLGLSNSAGREQMFHRLI